MHTFAPDKLLPVAIPRLLGTFTSDVEDQTFRFLVGTVPAWNLLHTWYNGTLVQWYIGTMVHWYIGTLVQPILSNRQRGVSSLPMRRMLIALLDSLIVMVTRMISSHNTRGTCMSVH